jgi:putative membrane protein
LLRSRLSEPLRLATRAIGIRAASEVSALVAVSPHASWDGAIVALRGLKVIREVAQLYGLRPGPAVIAALLRRVARSAVETATLEATSQAAADHFLNNLPLVRHLGAVAGASTAAFRMYRLANVTAQSCSPFAE